jgi:hypothetical protein
MVFQDLLQPVSERLDLLGPGQGVGDVALDIRPHYARLVVQVADPGATVALVENSTQRP